MKTFLLGALCGIVITVATQTFASSATPEAPTALPVAVPTTVPPLKLAPPTSERAKQIKCLADNIYHEARGESLTGQLAVALVTAKRTKVPAFPETVCSVVYQKSQFSWVARGNVISNQASYAQAREIAELVYDNYVATDRLRRLLDATHFHATSVKPRWAVRFRWIATIDNHAFYAMK